MSTAEVSSGVGTSSIELEINQILDYIEQPNDLAALIVLRGRNMGATAIGFYDNREQFIEAAKEVDTLGNCYINLNRLNPAVQGRASNRIQRRSRTRYTNEEVIRRRAFFIDLDPHRPAGVNSTEAEKKLAKAKAEEVRKHLLSLWGIDALMVDSGNGFHLYYLIDEPADTPLVAQVLSYVQQKFQTGQVKVDTTVSDASRITRLVGTLNCKGDDVPDRPQRYARVVYTPDVRQFVTTAQLQMLVPAPVDEPAPSKAKGDWTHEKLTRLLDTDYKAFGGHGWDYHVEQNVERGPVYQLQQCPFVEHHVQYRAELWINEGVLCYKCFSDDCDGENKKTGIDFVKLVGPKFLEPHLAITDELRLARHFVSAYSKDGIPTVCYYRGEWYLWDGIWSLVEDGFLGLVHDVCKQFIMENWPRDLRDKCDRPVPAPQFGKASVANVIMVLQRMVTAKQIGWLDGKGGSWIAFKDRILNLDAWQDGQLIHVDQTPAYFDPNALNYNLDYTEDEPALFLAKLREQFSTNDVFVVQEFGGYAMTADTSFQRILYIVGPPRSLKGTCERKMADTIGPHNAVSKTFKAFLGPHALEDVPNKTLLAISDSRPDLKMSRPGVELLLSISGQDRQNINPKGKAVYTAPLSCKCLVVSNEVANFDDPYGALLARFLFVETTVSYVGREDTKLLENLGKEQNKITWWFLRGLQRLMRNGRYTEPDNSLRQRFRVKNNPLLCFVETRCEVTGSKDDKLARQDLYEAYEDWCDENDVCASESNVFFRQLYSTFRPAVKRHEKGISGIKLKVAKAKSQHDVRVEGLTSVAGV